MMSFRCCIMRTCRRWSPSIIAAKTTRQQGRLFPATTMMRTSFTSNNNNNNNNNDILLRNDTADGIATLTLNRPKQYNTLTSDLLSALQHELETIRNDISSGVRVVILKSSSSSSSSSSKCFSSGHDLKELLHSSPNELEILFAKCSRTMTFLTRHLPQPVIAQVHGICTAAGTQLVASCDLATCSFDTKFGVNGIDVGLFCTTPAVALSRNIGRKQAMRMLLTGDFISGQQALDYGLVNQVVDFDKLDDTTMELARRIASKSSFAIQLGKQAFYKQIDDAESLESAYEVAGDVMCRNMDSHDAKEGIRAFLEKRTPEWKGK